MDAALDVGCGAGAPLAGLVVVSDGGGADGGVLVPHAVRRAVRDGYTVREGRQREREREGGGVLLPCSLVSRPLPPPPPLFQVVLVAAAECADHYTAVLRKLVRDRTGKQ